MTPAKGFSKGLSKDFALDAGIGVGIFVLVSWGVWHLTASAFLKGIDEGIYLEGGQKVLAGQVPYRDFFAFTGPLIYVVQAALEWLWGANLAMARWSVALPLGLCAAASYWIVRGFASRELALGSAYVQLLPHLLFFARFSVTHRLVSMGLLFATGACLMAPGALSKKRVFAAAMFAASSAWATPSFVLPLFALSMWVAWKQRSQLLVWVAGFAAISAPFAIWLGSQRALGPMLESLFWASSRYAKANAVPYGFLPVERIEAAQLPFLLIPLSIPVVLLCAAYVIWRRKQQELILLCVFAFSFFLTSYPRWDVLQLVYVLPPFIVLGAILSVQLLPSIPRQTVFALLLMVTSYRFLKQVAQGDNLQSFESRVGRQAGQPRDIIATEKLESLVPAGSTMFVFPYYPVAGYILKTHNPVRFSYLQPGMMSDQDEALALADLQRTKPQFVLRQELPDEAVLKIWPNSDRSKMTFPSLDAFVASDYEFVDEARGAQFALKVYRRKN